MIAWILHLQPVFRPRGSRSQHLHPQPRGHRSPATILLAAAFFLPLLTGCNHEPELQVPAREVLFWPAERYDAVQKDPQERYFTVTTFPPQVFFRPGADCGTVRHLSITVEGWPAAAGLPQAPVTAPPPAIEYFVSDRHAADAARFDPARPLEWEPRGGREVVEVRHTDAGASPTPVSAVVFQPGWVYRLTFLAEVNGGAYQRSVWLGPAGWRERALTWDAQ